MYCKDKVIILQFTMAVAASETTQVAVVPAWKRLGLKLKHQQPPSEANTPAVVEKESFVVPARKHKLESTLVENERPSKKRKQKSSEKINATSSEPAPESDPSNAARRKSVSFTQDTKAEDGDSVKQLFQAWVNGERAKDSGFDTTAQSAFATPEPPRVRETVDANLPEAERKVIRSQKEGSEKEGKKGRDKKKVKKQKGAKEPTTLDDRPFLRYLKNYCEERETWKFNKNHQNHLIKHAFDNDTIPSSYTSHLFQYIRGLQGGVRTRLRDAALKVKVEDHEAGVEALPKDMEAREDKQREYEAALSEHIAKITAATCSTSTGYEEGVILGLSDHVLRRRLAKRLRVEQILRDLDTSSDTGVTKSKDIATSKAEPSSSQPIQTAQASSAKRGRKRKQRTLADDASSSSDSSSESSSDNDSDSSASNHVVKVHSKRPAKTTDASKRPAKRARTVKKKALEPAEAVVIDDSSD